MCGFGKPHSLGRQVNSMCLFHRRIMIRPNLARRGAKKEAALRSAPRPGPFGICAVAMNSGKKVSPALYGFAGFRRSTYLKTRNVAIKDRKQPCIMKTPFCLLTLILGLAVTLAAQDKAAPPQSTLDDAAPVEKSSRIELAGLGDHHRSWQRVREMMDNRLSVSDGGCGESLSGEQ